MEDCRSDPRIFHYCRAMINDLVDLHRPTATRPPRALTLGFGFCALWQCNGSGLMVIWLADGQRSLRSDRWWRRERDVGKGEKVDGQMFFYSWSSNGLFAWGKEVVELMRVGDFYPFYKFIRLKPTKRGIPQIFLLFNQLIWWFHRF